MRTGRLEKAAGQEDRKDPGGLHQRARRGQHRVDQPVAADDPPLQPAEHGRHRGSCQQHAGHDRDLHVERGVGGDVVDPSRAASEPQHGRQEVARHSDRFGAEQDPAHHHGQQRIGPAQDGSGPRVELDQAHSLHDQQHAVVQAPQHERPTGAVPQAAQEEDQQQIEIDPRQRNAAAAQGNVDVIPQPRGKRYMPAPPEVLDRTGDIGVVEVLHELEAQHAAQSDRHVRVTGKVKVYLQRVGHRAQPGQAAGKLSGGQGKNAVGGHGHGVGDEHFLGQPDGETVDAGHELVGGNGPCHGLRRQVAIADDRAGNEVREGRNAAGEVDQVARGRDLPAIHVDRVTHRLERVEADAQGQRDPHHVMPCQGGRVDRGHQAIVGIEAEVEVLEVAQKGQIADDRKHQGQLLGRGPRHAGRQTPDRSAAKSGRTIPDGWLPALYAAKFGKPLCFKIASAMMEQAELPVQRKSTL